jgi:hypothetical protein
MTVDCEWIERNLEGLFSGHLTEEESRVARRHIEGCEACQREIRGLNAIDPLIKQHFRRQVQIACQIPRVNRARAVSFSGAAVALVIVLLFVVLRSPQANTVGTALPEAAQSGATASVETSPAVKDDTVSPVERSKPTLEPDQIQKAKPPATPAVTADSPEFLVTDPAGYTHSLEEYRGHVLVIAIWSAREKEQVANFERLYKIYGTNAKFRFLGVTSERQAKPRDFTFPVVYNQGSKLFGAQLGEFVVVGPMGSIELRGSLVKDYETLRKTLQGR